MKIQKIKVCRDCGSENPEKAFICRSCKGEDLSLMTIQPQKETMVQNVQNRLASQSWTGELNNDTFLFKDIQAQDIERFSSTLPELDRVLGGGIPKISTILLSAAPGAGKSTLVTQISGNLSKSKKIFYVLGEETAAMIKARAERLNVDFDNVYGYSETRLELILNEIAKHKPDLVIVDSIQCLFSQDIKSASGSVGQILACATALNRQSKEMKFALILIGHVTKTGDMAGPEVLKHLVDTTLKIELENNDRYRSISADKNRFNSTETGFFEMTEKGLVSVSNASMIFMPEDKIERTGSAIFPSLVGNRTVLVEIQTLTDPAIYKSPKRVSDGIDANRLNLNLALINRYGFKNLNPLNETDVYCSVLGGVDAKEETASLPLFLSLFSSLKDIPLPPTLVSFGEISLSGNLVRAQRAIERVKDSYEYGFKQILLPKLNDCVELHEFYKKHPDLQIFFIEHIEQLPSVLNELAQKNLNANNKNTESFSKWKETKNQKPEFFKEV